MELSHELNMADCAASLKDRKKTIRTLKDADIILGRDTDTGSVFVAYGRTFLKTIVAGGKPSQGVVMQMNLRQATLDLETLLAMVVLAKGRHDYEATGEVFQSAILDGLTRAKIAMN